MHEEEAFLRAICDNPEDDTPRLVFADWLDDQGGEVNAAWAELIRLQIMLVRDRDVEREHQQHLLRRDRELCDFLDPVWAERVGLPEGRWRGWWRGFPLSLEEWYSGPDVVRFASAPPIPVRDVELIDVADDEFREFLKWPGLRGVRSLSLWDIPGTFTAGLRALAECEHARNLERLNTNLMRVSGEVLTAILDSPHLARLTDFRLGRLSWWDLPESVRQRFRDRFGEPRLN